MFPIIHQTEIELKNPEPYNYRKWQLIFDIHCKKEIYIADHAGSASGNADCRKQRGLS